MVRHKGGGGGIVAPYIKNYKKYPYDDKISIKSSKTSS